MKILVLDQFSDPGGAQQGLLEFLPAVRERGWEALVAMPGHGELFERVRENGFATERIEYGPYASGRKSFADVIRFMRETPSLARHIGALARRIDANLVYVNGPRLLPAVARARLSVPVLFHAHSYLPPGASRRLAGYALRRVRAKVVANCEFVAHPWRAFLTPESVQVVYNGVGPSAVAPHRSTTPVVACIGRIAPEKGQLDFLSAAREIHRAIPDCRLQLIGAALFSEPEAARYDAEVRLAAAGLPVEFPGWIDDIYAALAGIDILLVPSASHEATTRVILEAYAAGVPVVAYRSGGIPEVIQEGETGYLAADAAEMAGIAVRLLRDPQRRAGMSLAARDCWRRRFSLERFRADLMGAIERAAAVRL